MPTIITVLFTIPMVLGFTAITGTAGLRIGDALNADLIHYVAWFVQI